MHIYLSHLSCACEHRWFRHEFFTWVTRPKCDACESDSTSVGSAAPSAEDRLYGAGMVEVYRCNNDRGGNCGKMLRFPRYNNAKKLMETRRGRCGEFAQAFALCARTMAFEVRDVLIYACIYLCT